MAGLNKEKKQTQTPSALNGRAIVDVNVKPLLLAVKKIMHLATTGISGIVPISCKCSDVNTTTQTIIETLSSYTWEAQIVIALAAFALNYGNFWLVGQLYQKNELAKYVAILQRLPSVLEPADTLKLKFKALIDVIKVMLEVTDCIFEFKRLPTQYISWNTPPFSTANAYFHQAAYMIIQSIVTCSSYITELIRAEIIYMDSSHIEPLKLSSQSSAIMSIHEKLKTQLDLCEKHIETAKENAAYEKFVKLFEATYTDNHTVVSTMFSADNHESLLIDSSNTTIEFEKLKKRNVLLFISDLSVTRDQLSYFHKYVHNHWKIEEMEYQFVWIQMVDESSSIHHQWTKELQNQCVKKLHSLPWYLVCNPTRLDRGLIRHIKEDWHFKPGKSQLVVLDHLGRVVNYNAIPDGGLKEWSIQSLAAASFDPWITQWVEHGDNICLYGGDKIEWIEKFQQKVLAFEGKTKRKMNMLYVGKSNRRENVGNCVKKFAPEENNEAFMEKIWLFWLRLESTWESKMQSINRKPEGMKGDKIIKEILTMPSLDGSNQGWALISDCSSNMAKGQGELIETCLDEHEKWMVGVKAGESFVPKLNKYLHAMIFEDHCCLPVILPSTIDILPPEMPCIICDKPMKKMATYRCCKE